MNSMKKAFVLCTIIMIFCVSCETTQLESFISSLGQEPVFTNGEAVSAMKEALLNGIEVASGDLSAEDGYYGNALLKIMLPPEADTLLGYINAIPGGEKLAEDVVLRLNRSAEHTASEAYPIFADAIRQMTVADGIAIVCGDDTAATEYLREKTYDQLVELYRPYIAQSLAQPLVLGISADTAWENLTGAYNRAADPVNTAAAFLGKEQPMPPVSADLAGYATGKALDGLFSVVADEEKKIRANPADYGSKVIEKVFGAVKQGLHP